MKNKKANVLLANSIISAGKKIVASGTQNLTRFEVANLLGLRHLSQFSPTKTKKNNLFLACWAIDSLNDDALESHQEFMNKFYFINYIPGMVKDVEKLKKALNHPEKQRNSRMLADKTKENIIKVLHGGHSVLSLNLSSSEVAQTRAACKNVLTSMFGDKRSAYKSVEERLNLRLRHFSARFYFRVLNVMARSVSSDRFKIEPRHISTAHLVSLLNNKDFEDLEDFYYQVYSGIEKFRHENYVLIKNFAKLMFSTKPPVWVNFFDNQTTSPPNLEDTIDFYLLFLELQDLPVSRLNDLALSRSVKSKRNLLLYPMGRIHEKMSDGEKLSEVISGLQLPGDLANYYKSYRIWLKKSKYFTYWRE